MNEGPSEKKGFLFSAWEHGKPQLQAGSAKTAIGSSRIPIAQFPKTRHRMGSRASGAPCAWPEGIL